MKRRRKSGCDCKEKGRSWKKKREGEEAGSLKRRKQGGSRGKRREKEIKREGPHLQLLQHLIGEQLLPKVVSTLDND